MITVSGGVRPVFGTVVPTLNYIRFLGFTVHDADSSSDVPSFNISGAGNEVGYNEVIGNYIASGDNHEGIVMDSATSTWIHNNAIHGWRGNYGGAGASMNSSGIKFYSEGYTGDRVEDNYIHDCDVGVYDKSGGSVDGDTTHTYIRNYIAGCYMNAFLGITQGVKGPVRQTYIMHDNVFCGSGDGLVQLATTSSMGAINSSFYNNLFIDTYQGGYWGHSSILSGSDSIGSQFWNNIMLTPGWTSLWSYSSSVAFNPNQVSYSDYNVYDSAPWWGFPGDTNYDLTAVRGLGYGYGAHSAVATDGSIFVDLVSYVLQPQWTTAGRYGDPVGPRIPIAQLLDTSRYGPQAFATGK